MKNAISRFSSRRLFFLLLMFPAPWFGNLQFAIASDFSMPLSVLQSKKVEGKIVDVNGEPIIGATVSVKGTSNGTITDFDGNFF